VKPILSDEKLDQLRAEIAEKAIRLDVGSYPLPPMGLDQRKLWALGGKAREYSTDYCAMIVAHMADGYSLESFAGAIATSAAIVKSWAEKFPEFAYAVEVGKAAQVFAHERIGMAIMRTGKGSADVFKFVMKNQHKWRDNIGLTGDDGGPIKTQTQNEIVWNDAAENRLAALLQKAANISGIEPETKKQLDQL
jgi:hypothetical protein